MLSVLLLASYWTAEFPDGWVTVDQFGSYARDLPEPLPIGKSARKTRQETLKRLVRRGVEGVEALLGEPTIERKRVGAPPGRDPREPSTRLRYPPSPDLEQWFTRFGLDRLVPARREMFRAQCYGALGTVSSITSTIEEGIINRLLDRGDPASAEEAAALATRALDGASSEHDRRIFALALAMAEINDTAHGGKARALARLRALADDPGPFRSSIEQLLQARVLTTLAAWLAIEQDPTPMDALDAARTCLDRARTLIPAENHAERGHFLYTVAFVEEQTARAYGLHGVIGEEAWRHRNNAELAVLAAIRAWRLAQQWDRIHSGLRLLSGLPGGKRLMGLDVERSKLLIPWLAGLVRYELTVPRSPEGEGPFLNHHLADIYDELLDAFNALPADIAPADLPLPARECYELLQPCIRAYRNLDLDVTRWITEGDAPLPVEKAIWFRKLREEDETGRSQ